MSKWQDIFSTQTWEQITGKRPVNLRCKNESVENTTIIQAHYSENLSEHGRNMIDEMGQLIAEYHLIPKTELALFDVRKDLLKQIEVLSGQYIALRGDNLELKKSRKLNPLHIHTYPRIEHYKDVGLGSIDMWIVSLHKQCKKKSAYLDLLTDFTLKNPQLNREEMISSIVKAEHKDGKLYPGVLLEMWDPLHRQSEFNPTCIGSDDYRDDKALPMNNAFNEWLLSEKETPFFLWLEDHPISRAHNIVDTNYQRVNSVNYNLSNAQFVKIGADANLAAKYENMIGDWSIFDCQKYKSIFNEFCWKVKTPRHSVAFVWDANDKNLFMTHPHLAGKYHHASISKGGHVRCAGMWVVNNGKVSYLSNSSGHYRNSTLRFYRLVKFLYKHGVLSDKADIVDLNNPKDNPTMPIHEYLVWAKQQPSIHDYHEKKIKKMNDNRFFSGEPLLQEKVDVKLESSASLIPCQIF